MPSYKLILALGLSDMGQILVVGLISGLFSVAGQTFNFWLNKISGAILFGNWFFSMTIASILALNRLAAMLELHFLERLFRNRKVLIWLLFVVLYGFSQFIYYMYPNNGVLFYPESCYWFFESDTNYEMSISIGMISDGITIAIMIFCYTSIGVFLKIKRSRTQVHSLKTQEIRALISSLVLSVNAIFLDLMFFIGPIINDDSWMATLNNVLWLICIGDIQLIIFL